MPDPNITKNGLPTEPGVYWIETSDYEGSRFMEVANGGAMLAVSQIEMTQLSALDPVGAKYTGPFEKPS